MPREYVTLDETEFIELADSSDQTDIAAEDPEASTETILRWMHSHLVAVSKVVEWIEGDSESFHLDDAEDRAFFISFRRGWTTHGLPTSVDRALRIAGASQFTEISVAIPGQCQSISGFSSFECGDAFLTTVARTMVRICLFACQSELFIDRDDDGARLILFSFVDGDDLEPPNVPVCDEIRWLEKDGGLNCAICESPEWPEWDISAARGLVNRMKTDLVKVEHFLKTSFAKPITQIEKPNAKPRRKAKARCEDGDKEFMRLYGLGKSYNEIAAIWNEKHDDNVSYSKVKQAVFRLSNKQ